MDKTINLAPVKIKPEKLILKIIYQILRMTTRCVIFTLFTLCLISCKEGSSVNKEIAEIDLELKVLRFDRDFATATAEDLPDLKVKYPYLFPEQYPDSIWLRKMQDTVQIALLEEVDVVFEDFEEEEAELELLLKHLTYYFPDLVPPKVVTITSDVDYNNRVILADSLLLLGLDNYLGQDHRFYRGISRYISRDFDKKYLVSDVASAYANMKIGFPTDRTFLSQMIFYGKILYMKDLWMPGWADTEKIHYSEEELAWAEANEEQIWRYFIEREYLYSTDQGLLPRFLEPAPFSKFRLELDSESPGRVGRYIGWMIVRSYMDKNDTDPLKMLSTTEDVIFKNSGYKPKK